MWITLDHHFMTFKSFLGHLHKRQRIIRLLFSVAMSLKLIDHFLGL